MPKTLFSLSDDAFSVARKRLSSMYCFKKGLLHLHFPLGYISVSCFYVITVVTKPYGITPGMYTARSPVIDLNVCCWPCRIPCFSRCYVTLFGLNICTCTYSSVNMSTPASSRHTMCLTKT